MTERYVFDKRMGVIRSASKCIQVAENVFLFLAAVQVG